MPNVLDSLSNVVADRHYRVTERGCADATQLTYGYLNLTEYHNLTGLENGMVCEAVSKLPLNLSGSARPFFQPNL